MSPISAQGPWIPIDPVPCITYDPENSIPWPDNGYGDPLAFGRLVVAELDGDQAAEAVVLAGGAAIALWKVAVYDVPQRIDFPTADDPSGVTEIVTLAGGGGTSGTDAVLMCDARGIFKVTYENGIFPDPPPWEFPAWANARRLHVEDLDADGIQDVLGVSADKRSILRLHGNPDGSFDEDPPTTLLLDVLDVAWVDWDGVEDPPNSGSFPRELIALTRRGLIVYLPSGTQVISHLSVTGCIARFRTCDAPGGERLAWTRRVTGGTVSELIVISQGYQENCGVLSFTPPCAAPMQVEPIAILAGNYDGDVNEDLVLAQAAHQTAIALWNLSDPVDCDEPVVHFDPTDSDTYDLVELSSNPAALGGPGIPDFADVDGEEPDDLVFPVSHPLNQPPDEPLGTVEVFLTLPYIRSKYAFTSGQTALNSALIIREETEYSLDPPEVPAVEGGGLRLGFHVPNRYATYEELDVVVWRQLGSDENDNTETYRSFHRRYGLHSSADYQYTLVWSDLPTVNAGFPGGDCWPETAPPDLIKPYYFLELRFVDEPGPSEIRSRIFAGGFTLVSCDLGEDTSFHHLTSVGIGHLIGLYEENGIPNGEQGGAPSGGEEGGGSNTVGSRTLLGAFMPMEGVPYFGPGSNPNAGGWTWGSEVFGYTPP